MAFLPPGYGLTPVGAASGAMYGAEGFIDSIKNLLGQKSEDVESTYQGQQFYFPNYPGNVVEDLTNNPLINWERFLSPDRKGGSRIKGYLMNQGVDVNDLIARQPKRALGTGRPAPTYMNPYSGPVRYNMGGFPTQPSPFVRYPQGFTPFTPFSRPGGGIFNQSGGTGRGFKPGPTFRMDQGGFGVEDLINAIMGSNSPAPGTPINQLPPELRPPDFVPQSGVRY